MKVERIKGFRDQYPEDMGPRKRLIGIAEEQAEKFGFRKIDVPSLESLDLYRIKSGEELVSQTYSFMDKGGREVTMIPEFTPSVVRMLTARKDLPRPIRWYGTPKLWRYEEPQAGRYREHIQFNADIFGADTPEADAEVIGLAASILDALGLKGEYEIRVSNRELLEKVLSGLGIGNVQAAFAIIDRFRKIERDDFIKGLKEAGATDHAAEMLLGMISEPFPVENLVEKAEQYLPGEAIDRDIIDRITYMGRLVSTYTESGVKYDFSIVRGIAYYTGIVFEAFDVRGEYRSILGGGRYDRLAGLLSDQDIPAVGFGMGDAVIELLLRRTGKWIPDTPSRLYYIAGLMKGDRTHIFKVANAVRKHCQAIVDISGRGLSAQLKSAASSGCTHAVIIGEREASAGIVTLRDLSTGNQEELAERDFISGLS